MAVSSYTQKEKGKNMLPISVCVIAKNEEKHMEEFLKRLRPYDWEIVVADTGSTDRTKEIAAKYADKVCDFRWNHDFAAARNYAISQASRSFILSLDCDEYLEDVDIPGLRQWIARNPAKIGLLTIRNHVEANEKEAISVDSLARFFPRKFFHWRNPVHEQVAPLKKGSCRYAPLPLTVEHYGYQWTKNDKKAKIKRNNDILLAWLEREPDNAYVNFQLGQSYFTLGEYENAYPYFHKSFLLEHDPQARFVWLLTVSYGYTLLYTGRLKEAEELLRLLRSDQRYRECADTCCLAGSIYLHRNQYLQAMGEFIKAMSSKTSFQEDAKYDIPVYNIGYIQELLGDRKAALEQYRRCRDFPKAARRIRILEESGSGGPGAVHHE
jgi:glycosyltransferase involved in cell wall biosynthesis